MSSEQRPGPLYHTSPPSIAPQSQQLPLIPAPKSHAGSQSTPDTPHQPSTPLPIQEVHQATQEPSRKRARPTVSCFECRRKKLKCDRVQPCIQCVKGRREDLCQFATGVTKVGVSRARAQSLAAGRDENGESAGKRMRIEDVMTSNLTPGDGRAEDLNRRDASAPGSTLGRIYVKGSSSRYLGVGDRMAMLDQFDGAKSYIINSFKDPNTKGMMYELTRYQDTLQGNVKNLQVQIPYDRTSLMTEMLKSLPAGGSPGSTLYFYEAHWEGLTRVLHMPTLIQEIDAVEEFIRSRAQGGEYSLPQNIRESVVPQMIGIYVLSARLNKLMTKDISEDQIAIWIEMMQRWLHGLKGKEKLNLQTLRVQTLLLLSKMNNLFQPSDLWKESGTIVRSAMVMGLHQDPEGHESLSIYDKEQRRKLWRTIVELDTQFSLACGMPAAIRSSDFKSRPLRKVNDFALKEDMITYPDDEANGLWTDALPQFVLSASIKERLDATNILGGKIDVPEDTDKLLGLAEYFEYSLQGLSSELSGTESSRGQSDERSPGRLLMKVMLDVQLRRPTLCIYQNILLSEHGSQYPETQKGLLRNAIAILSHLDSLDPEVADPSTIKNRDQLNLFHVLCKKDIIQAAFILCHEIKSFTISSREREGNVNGMQSLREDILPWTKTSLTRIVENTLNSLLHRVGEFGSDLKDILSLSIALQSSRSDGSPEDKQLLMRKGTERVLKACREALPMTLNTTATSHNGTIPNSAVKSAQSMPSLPQSYNSNEYPILNQPIPRFGDFKMMPGNDLSFPDFDFGFDDWNTDGSWS